MNGVLFGDYHSYRDFELVLAPFEMPPAAPKTEYIAIPGADSELDLTEVHGEVKYSDRTPEFSFTVLPGAQEDWETKKTRISNLLNGRKLKITLDKDPEYYYIGRCTVNDIKSDRITHTITITAKVAPYKLKQNVTTVSVALTTAGKTVTLTNDRKSVCPMITCTNDNTMVEFNGNTFTLNAGTHKVLNIMLLQGENVLKVSGSGTITFTYQEGAL